MNDHPAERDKEMVIPEILPVVAVRDITLYPFIIYPFSVGRDSGVAAVEASLNEHRLLVMLGQRDQNQDNPGRDELYDVGTVASVVRMIKLPDGRLRILVQGISRCKVEYFTQDAPYREAKIQLLQDQENEADKLAREALMRTVKGQLERLAGLGKPVSSEVLVMVSGMDMGGRLADLVAGNIEIKPQEGQRILEEQDVLKRLQLVNDTLSKEMTLLEMQAQIHSQARGEMDRSQRDFYLRQQLKIIQSELGEGTEIQDEVAGYREKLKTLKLPEEAHKEVEKQIRRMENMSPDTAETGLIRTYLDWMLELPWNNYSKDHLDLKRAKKYLDKEHYGLEEIKERIMEFLAVRKLNPQLKTPILCFVGPPGVGKTSLGQSIAKAMGRKFHRISLGGLRDEAEIRGHRKTYVGALPGRIIQGISQAGTMNPIFMLDEVDKIGQDFRGDPSSALLEVLDPEQNKSFRDHYLGVTFDLSNVLFILTANTLDTLQPAFRDRLEIIELGSYTLPEKVQIAARHLVPKQMREHGLNRERIAFSRPILETIIRGYTRESGLRNLERLLAKSCRKVARKVAEGDDQLYRINKSNLTEYLGPVKVFPDFRLKRNQVGVVAGLAWTSVGGEILFVEVTRMPGKGNLLLTGQLGDVMKESAKLALSLIRDRAEKYALSKEVFSESDIHVHFPEGATPKDGPSAGITVATAILSCLTQRPVRAEVAMTGELTLRGDILPIGGLKEKVLAAVRAQIKTVIFPELNESDWQQIPEDIRKGLDFFAVGNVEEVFKIALV